MLYKNSIFLKKYPLLLFLIFLLIFQSIQVYGQNVNQNNRVLSIIDVAELTLENNKNILVSKSNVEVAEGNILKSKSVFNLKFKGSIDKTYTITPLTIDQRENLSDYSNSSYTENDLFDYTIGAYKKFKFGTIINPGITFTNFGKDTLYNYLYEAGSGEYITNRSKVYLNLNQPILKGAGKEYNTADLRISKKRYQLTEEYYYHNISTSLLESFIAYLEYIGVKKNLEIQENIDDKFLLVIHQIEKLIEMDAIPASDLNYLKANYTARKSELVDAQNQLQNYKIHLANKIGLDREEIPKMFEPPNEYIISDIELVSRKEDYIGYSYRQSLMNRKDYLGSELLLDVEKELVKYYKKSLKPTLDLNLSIGYNGIYESGNFDQYYKPYFENIPGINYKVGISFVIDANNDLNNGNLIVAKGNYNRQKALSQSLEEDIYINISKFYNDIINYKEIVLLYKETVRFYEEALENENIKLKLGTSTVINLVQIQNDYYLALDLLYSAILNLNMSILYYRYHTGTLCSIIDDNTIDIDYQNLFSLPFKFDNY
ncbi:MAG: TolC family protein [Bacteroidales bacterium]|nr:TolC family protein [Bacteroidales bacterium]